MKQGEKEYYRKLGPDGIWHAINKPFSDIDCGKYLIHLGVIFKILPPPPARLLDLGCGTGWTTEFFAKRGYECVGVDISEDAIEYAKQYHSLEGKINYYVMDYENLQFNNKFDIVIFYDSLHHAEDEFIALKSAYNALVPGGYVITLEPGIGHSITKTSRDAVKLYNVNEKDMPPAKIVSIAKKIGFRKFRMYNSPDVIFNLFYQEKENLVKKLKNLTKFLLMLFKLSVGITVLQK